MVNTRLLKAAIVESGMKQSEVAEKIGISYQSLSDKINNKTEFKVNEVTSKFQKEASVGDYIRESCSLCGVTLHTDISRLPNINHVIHEFPDKKNVTYRQIIQWCAALSALWTRGSYRAVGLQKILSVRTARGSLRAS